MTMNMWLARIINIGGLAALVACGGGCAAFRGNVADVDIEKGDHMRAEFDFRDLRAISGDVVNELLAEPLIAEQAAPPVFMIAGVQNRTSEYLDTKMLTDTVRTKMIQSKKVRFVNEARREDLLKEQGYQAANVDAGTEVAIGKQLGAKYMLSGAIGEMKQDTMKQVRVSKTIQRFYQLTMEMTDLQTGELVWTTQKEFARKERQPLIGW
jgi:hypothetical protein